MNIYGDFIGNSQNWKQPRCSSMDEWLKKSHPNCGILLSNKNNELLVHATTWMNPEEIMLSKKLVSKRYILHDSSFIPFVK